MMVVVPILLFVGIAHAMKAYQSTLPVRDDEADAGLRLVADSALKTSDFDKGLTLCGRFNYRRLSVLYAKMFEVTSWQAMSLSMGYQQTNLRFGQYSWVMKDEQKDTFQIWIPNRWTHICLSFNKTAKRLLFFKDGVNLLDKVEADFHTGFLSPALLKNVAIGKRVEDGKEGYSRHAGTMMDINIWDVPLTIGQLKNRTDCKLSSLTGNIVDWETSQWILTNVQEMDVSESSLCNADSLGPTLIPEKLAAEESVSLCQKLSGQTFVIKDQTNLEITKQISLSAEELCFNGNDLLVWAGWSDEFKEGYFIDMNNGQLRFDSSKFDSHPWKQSEPNGDRQENCVIFTPAGFQDIDCKRYERCSICDISDPPTFRLRGLPLDSKFDKDYAWTGQLVNKRFIFNGFSSSQLSYDGKAEAWKLNLRGMPEFAMTSGSPADNYPLGINLWQFQNETQLVKLSFSACGENDFNCNDGTCVNISQRCDGSMDCKDKSDEFACHKIKSNQDFDLKATPPPSFVLDDQGIPSGKKQKLDVLCHVKIINFLDINEVSAIMTLQLQIQLEWIDPRIDFLNLKINQNLNVLTQDEKEELWMPTLIFNNTANKQQARFKNVSADGYIQINDGAKAYQNPTNELHNGYHHAGKDCTIVVSDFFTVNFIYNYQMKNYPFDIQKFQALMDPIKRDLPFVQLVPGNVTYQGPLDLMKNTIQSYKLQASGNQLVLEIVLGRQLLNVIMTTVLPTVIIVIVSFSTNYYGDHFDAIVTVNLTALLVMVTLFISVFTSLPRTSAMKMIDAWFIFTLFIPFLEVILHTKMEMINWQLNRIQVQSNGFWSQNPARHQEIVEKKKLKMRTINRMRSIATYGVPIMTLIFLFGFFLVGFVVVYLN